MKKIQIPDSLFVALVRYHLLEDNSSMDTIKRELEEKLDSLLRHDLYEKYKTAPTQEEREKARMEYLDRRGVKDSFRW